jgi:hypothetical protein
VLHRAEMPGRRSAGRGRACRRPATRRERVRVLAYGSGARDRAHAARASHPARHHFTYRAQLISLSPAVIQQMTATQRDHSRRKDGAEDPDAEYATASDRIKGDRGSKISDHGARQ